MLTEKTSNTIFEISRGLRTLTNYVNGHFKKLYVKQDALEVKANTALEGIVSLDRKIDHQEALIKELLETVREQTKTIESLRFRLARSE